MWESIKNFIINEYFLSVLSIVSLIFSVITFFISYKINNKINKIKKDTVNKIQFENYRISFINQLNTYEDAIKKANSISKTSKRDLLIILTKLKAYTNVFSQSDMSLIISLYHRQNKISCVSINAMSELAINEELKIITEIKTILEKGDYCI
ncbi:MAG: hypothetical protein HFI43_12820 [Lachnospiraceae bacterium]|jgi:hypothetical protein|nr:hypothetical protein [Lachnospiraceae bacterium]